MTERSKQEIVDLENYCLLLLKTTINFVQNLDYLSSIENNLYEIKANNLRVRNKCDWYEHREKSTRCWLLKHFEKNFKT